MRSCGKKLFPESHSKEVLCGGAVKLVDPSFNYFVVISEKPRLGDLDYIASLGIQENTMLLAFIQEWQLPIQRSSVGATLTQSRRILVSLAFRQSICSLRSPCGTSGSVAMPLTK